MKIGFCGCSLTEGVPFVELNQRYSDVVCNSLGVECINLAKGGSGNREILVQALTLLTTDVDCIFVEWSAPGRARFQTFYDMEYYTNSPNNPNRYITDKNYKNFVDVFKIVDSSYNQYAEINTQITILNNLSEKLDKKIYYINGLMHIDPVFLNTNNIENIFESMLPTTRDIIDLDHLPDDNLIKCITEIRNFLSVIDVNQWVSIETIKRVDKGIDGSHPGPKSNEIFANTILQFLKEKNFG